MVAPPERCSMRFQLHLNLVPPESQKVNSSDLKDFGYNSDDRKQKWEERKCGSQVHVDNDPL